jgi:hypothetical protein
VPGVALKLADIPPPKFEPLPHIDQWLLDFAKAHPEVANAVLTRRVASKDKRAKKVLAHLAPPSAKKAMTPAALAKQILAALDKSAGGAAGDWPLFDTGIEDDPWTWEYFELRVLAVRSASSDDWGIVFERVSGSYDRYEKTRVQRYLYGSTVKEPGWDTGRDILVKFRCEREPDAANGEKLGIDVDGVTVTGARGPLVLDAKQIAERDLKPGYGSEFEGDPGFNLRLRAYIDRFPGAFFAEAGDLVGLLGIGDAAVVCDSTAFAHVVGKRAGKADRNRLPSKSSTYQSLAKAIATRDPAAFEPGASNLDFRLHAIHPTR